MIRHRPEQKSSKYLLLLLFICCLSVAMAWASTHVFAAEVTVQKTVGGQSYWHYPIAKAKRTAVAITWPSGIGNLPIGDEVGARLGIDLMLNGGAGGKAADEIIADFKDLDAGSRLFVQPREIRGFIVTPDLEAVKAAGIANDVLAKPHFSTNWFGREKAKWEKSSRGRESNIFGLAWNLSRSIIMPGHAFERFWSVRPAANIENLDLKTIKAWHADAFKIGGLKIVVSGSSDFEGIGKSIDRALEGLPQGNAVRQGKLPDLAIPAKTILFHKADAKKSMIIVFGKLPAATTNQELATNVSLGVLGYGAQSRLFKAVRSGLRASYGFGSGYIDYTRDQRLMRLSGEVETAKLQIALDEVRATYEIFRKDGIGFIEFPFARRFYRQRVEGALTKPAQATHLLMEGRLNGAPMDHVSSLIKNINNLERGKVNAFIKSNFTPFDDLLKIIVTPDATAIRNACVITAIEQVKRCL